MIKYKIYTILTSRFPFLWKLFRYILWFKSDFNSKNDWDVNYNPKTDEDLFQYLNRIPKLIEAAISIANDFKHILEVSAGMGNFICKIPEFNKKDITATEYSKYAIDYLESKNINVIKAMLPILPFKSSSFDLVVSISVFEHLSSKKIIKQSFKECHRITNNCFLLSVPYQCMHPKYTLEHNFDFSKNDIIKYTSGLFKLIHWQVVYELDGSSRSISLLKKND